MVGNYDKIASPSFATIVSSAFVTTKYQMMSEPFVLS